MLHIVGIAVAVEVFGVIAHISQMDEISGSTGSPYIRAGWRRAGFRLQNYAFFIHIDFALVVDGAVDKHIACHIVRRPGAGGAEGGEDSRVAAVIGGLGLRIACLIDFRGRSGGVDSARMLVFGLPEIEDR